MVKKFDWLVVNVADRSFSNHLPGFLGRDLLFLNIVYGLFPCWKCGITPGYVKLSVWPVRLGDNQLYLQSKIPPLDTDML